MISLKDISDIMQMVVSAGATFMFSPSGIPGYYNIYASYYSSSNKSVGLTLDEKSGIIYQSADIEHPIIEFKDKNSVVKYIFEEIGIE